MAKIHQLLTCFRYIATPAIVITIIISFQIWQSQSVYFLIFAIWSKLITTGLLLLYIFIFRSGQFYFFNNLGLSHLVVYGSMALVDALIAVVAFGIALQFI